MLKNSMGSAAGERPAKVGFRDRHRQHLPADALAGHAREVVSGIRNAAATSR